LSASSDGYGSRRCFARSTFCSERDSV
jgi:hypothetical protein